ncbi:MAG TPA: ribosome small subunit-dependent GTPase A [bacterium]|nr:ribosome small subunit-dependent GTPase A [bacterium]
MSASSEELQGNGGEFRPDGERAGRIAAMFADRCLVWSDGQEIVCALRGRLKERATPVVGDRVNWLPTPDGGGAVTTIHPRTSELTRAVADRKRANRPLDPQVLAANVDRMVVVASVRRPPLRPGLLDRFLVVARRAGIAPLICITKLDLDPGGEFAAVEATYTGLGIPVLGTDMHRPETVEPLAAALQGITSVLVGHSGVGKTSLLNLLVGLDMAVREVGFHKDRGRHTTSTARLVPLKAGGFAIDSPGIREFGLHGVAPDELATLYPDFAPYLGTCRFADCLHQGEPKCAVRAAAEAGAIQPARYSGYLKLLEEAIQRAQAAAPA